MSLAAICTGTITTSGLGAKKNSGIELSRPDFHVHIGYKRVLIAAYAAVQSKVRLMVDAEHSYFQPAIDHAATELQRKYNRDEPHILNTYQCYLKVIVPLAPAGGGGGDVWCSIR